MKAFADDKFSVLQCMKFNFYRIENIVGKGNKSTACGSQCSTAVLDTG